MSLSGLHPATRTDFIVLACNSHDAMVAALEKCRKHFAVDRTLILDGTDGDPERIKAFDDDAEAWLNDTNDHLSAIDAALALAKGKTP